MLGLTDTLIGLVVPLNRMPPVIVPLHGPVPATAIFNVALLLVHMVCVPLIIPVGRGLTAREIALLMVVSVDGQIALLVITTVITPPVVPASV